MCVKSLEGFCRGQALCSVFRPSAALGKRGNGVDLLPSLLQDRFERGVVVNLFKDRTPPHRAVERVVDISSSCHSWSSGHDAIIPTQPAFRKRMRPDPISTPFPHFDPISISATHAPPSPQNKWEISRKSPRKTGGKRIKTGQ